MNATENLENSQDFSMQDYMSQLLTTEALIKQEAQKKFSIILTALVDQLTTDANVKDEALASASFAIDGSTVALRLNAKTSLLECYCDLGVSETTYETQAAQRKLLEANLCDTYPNILFGAHPESQRLVAFAKINIFMLDDAGQVAMNTVTQLVAAAQAIRAW